MNRVKKYLLIGFSFICLLLIPVLITHAEPGMGGNADGSGGGSGTKHVVGGPYYPRTGWLVYIVDEESNAQITETKVFYSTGERPPSSCIWYPATRFGGSSKNYTPDGVAEWNPPTPYGDGGVPHGSAVKSFMLKENYALKFVDQVFGTAVLEAFTKEKHCLIMEPFYWGQMYNGSAATGVWLCATAYGWADYQNRYGFGEYGSSLINRYTNNTYPNCVKLEFPQFGLTPASGKLSNGQIMSSGNGFLAIWANEDIELPEDTEEIDEGRKLYAIKNWSDEYDISKGIPSGENVNNAYEADSFFANTKVKTVESDPERYSATYTYKAEVPKQGDPLINPATGDYMRDEYGRIIYDSWTEWETVATYPFSFTAKASYQLLAEIQAYALDNLKVVNDAFARALEYDSTNSSVWYDVTTDIKRYLGDGGYDNSGLLGCIDTGEHHYFLPEPSIIEDQIFYVDSTSAAYARMDEDVRNAKQLVYDSSWSRNDNLVITAGPMEYIFMRDEIVEGCIITGFENTSAANSDYRYGGFGLYTDSVEPVRAEGTQETIIPPSTDNLSFPSGAQAVYKNLANTKSELNVVLRAGRGVFDTGIVDDIYKHIIESDNSYGEAHNHQDYPGGDGYDIKVHTPVISPIMITTYLGTPQWYPDEQLIDVDESVDFQLKLDANYMVKWNLDQWVSYKYGELMGYEEDGGYPSRYDKYVERKELKFPFDVYYEGEYYEAGTWIHVTEPNDYEAYYSDGLSLEQRNNYESNNHWQMTPFYIPSYSEEGSGTIEARVYAYNVEGRYEGSHNVAEAMELKMNTVDTNYIATYEVTDQLSGHIYGFTVTGVDDKDMYYKLELDKKVWDRLEYGLCPVKEEKVSGTKNRFGEDFIRYQTDGTLHEFKIYANGHIEPSYNLLPLREGSNETAGMHTGDGRLWLGTGFGFNLKTIANLWEDDDYIEITPTFKFYAKDGTLVDTIRMDGDTVKSTNNRLVVLYQDGTVLRNFFDTDNQKKYTVAMGSDVFDDAYYTDKQYIDGKRYGSWVDYTLERWNKSHGLSGTAARNEKEMMELAWLCYTNTKITLDKNLRMLSGEFEQLYKNRQREGSDVATYFDFNEDGYYDNGIKSSLETDFRDSMQTWYGGYCMPGRLLIYDNINGDFTHRDNLSMEDFSTDFEVVINFDIIAYKGGDAHLGYGGYINGGKVWEKEGYVTEDDTDDITYDEGDVVIYDTEHGFEDKFEGHLIDVN